LASGACRERPRGFSRLRPGVGWPSLSRPVRRLGLFARALHPSRIVIPTEASHPERDGKRSGGTCCFFRLRQSRQFARGYNCERPWWGEMKIRPLLIVLSLSLPLAASAQEQCPQFSGPARVRLEQQARWLVSDSLEKQIAARSSGFGRLIAFERCHILQSNLLSEQVTEEEGPFFVSDGVPLKSRVGRYQRTWMMVIAPTEATGTLPNANVLKITDHKWALLNRDKDGSTRVLAKGVY
jgi:hypothetical protein